MHGVGYQWIERAFQEMHSINHLPTCLAVPSQRDPDANFPTVAFPNPEEKGVSGVVMSSIPPHCMICSINIRVTGS